jgi:hypothetical protein
VPLLNGEYETSWNTTTSPKALAAFDAVAGDVLVAAVAAVTNITSKVATLTNTGTALVWTRVASITTAGKAHVEIQTTTVVDDTAGMVVTSAWTGGVEWGTSVCQLRVAQNTGNADTASSAAGAPSDAFATSADDSFVLVLVADTSHVDGAARVWREPTPITELLYFHDTAWTAYLGYHADAGVVGTSTVGLSAPSQNYALAVVEVPPSVDPPLPEQTDVITIVHAR